MTMFARRLARYLPIPLQQALREIAQARAWRLPPPLTGARLVGPGVYGTYIARRHEPAVVQLLSAHVRPGWTCVDVGAHYGYFALLLARLVGPTGQVVAFEASPENVAILRRNLELNGLNERVSVQPYAVTDGAAPAVQLTLPTAFTLEWTLEHRPGVRAIKIPARSLDQHFAPHTQIDMIKLDIEGAEELAVPGMRRIIAECRPLLLLELHGTSGRNAAIELQHLGYQLRNLESGVDYLPQQDDGTPPNHIVARFA